MTERRSVLNLIGGSESPARSGMTLPVLNPHNSEVIADCAASDASDVAAAIGAAVSAQAEWAAMPAAARGNLLHQACNALEARGEEIARIVALEAGKKMADARGELGGAVACGRFFAGEGQRLFGRTMGSGVPERWNMTVRAPCGVAALITAANTPAPNFAWKVFPALICGNAVVLKPAEDTPVSAFLMAQILNEFLPSGVLNVVNGYGREIGPALVDDERIDVISFTGSTAVGRQIAESAGRQLKKVSLELGGKNPFVVWHDAELDNAVNWAALSAFSNAGQRCAAASRLLVHDRIYDKFLAALIEKSRTLKLGIGDDCDLGPVINERQMTRMLSVVEDVEKAGAVSRLGGKRETAGDLGDGFYVQPTIIENVSLDSLATTDELFGPIASIYRIHSYEEAITLANRSPYGLTSAIHTQNFDLAMTFCREVSAGVATVNGGTFGSEPHMPFGGVRASGNGTREPGTEALDVYTELKDVYLNVRSGGIQ